MKNYFTEKEFECKCGNCGLKEISPTLIVLLNKARAQAGVPFVINSGVRCPAHNETVGGSNTSSHMPDKNGYGHAVDIACSSSENRYKIVAALIENGATRIGIAENFIHVDTDPAKTQGLIWVY